MEARLFGSDQTIFWLFSQDVALDGDTALVGAPGADVDGATDRGEAYVFVRQDGEWIEEARLLASDGAEGDYFGWSVALDGDSAVVGARFAEVGGEGDEGAAYVFERSGTRWSQVQKLVSSDGNELDYFGYSATIEVDTVVVGARGADGGGAAYVFVRQGPTWVEVAKLFDPDAGSSDAFGSDVVLQAETLLIGAPSALIDGDAGRGAAYVYLGRGGLWSLQQQLLASDGAIADFFGNSVALDHERALIGAWQKDIDGQINQGEAYLFRRSGTTWTEEQRLTASDGGQTSGHFGIGTALQDGVALVAGKADLAGQNEQGVVYEYRNQGGIWVDIQRFAAPEGNGIDSFGEAMDLTADRLLVSHVGEAVLPPQGGSAWIFGRPILFDDGFESGDTSGWSQTVP